MRSLTSHSAGFTLVELLAGTTIFAIIMVLLISILNSFEATTDIQVTRQRMAEIADKAGEYYLSRENLPVPTATAMVPAPMGEVPLIALHLDAKYRIDSWGRPFHYFAVRNDGANGRPGQILIDPLSTGGPAGVPLAMVDIPQANVAATPPTGRTLITGVLVNNRPVAGVLVNNRPVAGVLISSGPNNLFEYSQTNGYPELFALNAGSDDIILAIDLTSQATQIAQTELKKLGEKVRAFDDRYIGKDNNDNGEYDEADPAVLGDPSCVAIPYPLPAPDLQIGDTNRLTLPCRAGSPPYDDRRFFPYYPSADYLPFTNNDYSCGVPTLDFMQANYCDTTAGNCPAGYYNPDILEWDYNYIFNDHGTPDPSDDTWDPVRQNCGQIGADYFRVPMDRGNSSPADCHWGLVGDPALDDPVKLELTNDQARAFIFCAYGLSPADIVDPWLNGYTWGCANGCANNFPDPEPRFHKFFSAGPNGIIDPPFPSQGDDIVAPL